MKPVRLGQTNPDRYITVTIHLRRRLDHAPIPSFEDYIGCPQRERLSNDDFAKKWGAHQDDIDAVSTWCQTQGLAVLSSHAARRHVKVQGKVKQFNAAFGVTIHDHEKDGMQYHAPLHDAIPPHHLTHTIIHVGLGEHPKDRMTETNVPATTPGVNGAPGILPAAYAALMGWPATGAAGQTIAVLTFEGTPYSLSDVQATWSNWGVAQGTIINISVDGTPITTNTFNGEWNMDIDVAYGFAVGATIAVYWTGVSTSTNESYSRIIFPEPGDPICSVTTASGAYLDEASLYTQPSLAAAVHLIYEDAALQGITVCVPTGDWGSGADVGDGKDHCGSENDPYVLAVGGTVVGNISGNSFVEWLANIGVSNDALYQTGGGGGISLYVPVPSYQLSANLPVSTNGGKAGRGIPDVSSSYASQFPQIENGGLNLTAGGTSQSTPMMAGLIASINKAVGRSVGFINPTLYAHPTTLCRDLNPTNTSGGPQSNANGYWIDSNSVEHSTAVPGYPVTTGWDACTGLGVINGNALISYLTSNAESPTIVGTTFIGGTLQANSPNGTVIGTIKVQMAEPGAFNGTFSLNSAASPYLAINAIGVLTNIYPFPTPGPYSTGVIVTQNGAANSPYSDTNFFTVVPAPTTGASFTQAFTLVTGAFTINTPNAYASSAFQVSGSMSGFATAPSLVYVDDGGTPVAIGSNFVGTTIFSFSHPGLPAGSHTLAVYVAGQPASSGATISYTVQPAYAPSAPTALSLVSATSSSLIVGLTAPDANQAYTYTANCGTAGSGGPFPTIASNLILGLGPPPLFPNVITIPGLVRATTYWCQINAVGPTGLAGASVVVGPFATKAATLAINAITANAGSTFLVSGTIS